MSIVTRVASVIGAPVAPGEAGPVLHRGGVRFGSMPQRELRQIPLQGRDLIRSLAEVKLALRAMTRQFIAQGHQNDAVARRGRQVVGLAGVGDVGCFWGGAGGECE
jgi:hypothetical protein